MKVDLSSPPLPSPPLPDSDARWALFLDVDGCLVDFADNPSAIAIPPTLRDTLSQLHERLGGALALVSGRRIDDLDRLFDAPGWAMAGLHGLQMRHADGSRSDLRIDPAQVERMQALTAALARRLDLPREDKGVAVALHARAHPERLPALKQEAANALASLCGYELQHGNHVVEFKPVGMDKGTAVQALHARAPFAARRCVYLGDDLTDEHAFATANRLEGLSVRVGPREPTLAAFTLTHPSAVHAWLACVLRALEPIREHHP